MRKTVISILSVVMVSIFLIPLTVNAQLGGPREMRRMANVSPDELISMSKTLPFNQALDLFNVFSNMHLQKMIIDPESRTQKIEVDINNMHWLDALETVLERNDLWYEEFENHILIIRIEESTISSSSVTAKELFETREVVISAVFFEANHNNIRQLGSDWSWLSDSGTIGLSSTAGNEKPSLMQFNIGDQYDFGSILATFKVLESKQVGEILASPKVTVRSGKLGRIQIGSDFTITTKDFAGNTVTQFFSTGSIISVTPDIIDYDGKIFVNLELHVTKSSAAQSEIGVEVKKTEAQTSILLLDKEETLIGGLFTTEKSASREGIPFLKDLPPWFFGLRYIFGFNTSSNIRKELLILLRAELVPSLAERLAQKSLEADILRRGLDEYRDEMKNYRDQGFMKDYDFKEVESDTTKTIDGQ
jgi:Bacterial type II and III secretion system protein